MTLSHRFARVVAAAALVLAPLTATAQSALPSADAAAFMGTWTISLESPQGAFEQTLALSDKGGKVAGELTSPIAPGPTAITDIAKEGSDLLCKFAGDFQGNAFDATLRLTPSGDGKASVSLDIMNGQFVMQGTGTKK